MATNDPNGDVLATLNTLFDRMERISTPFNESGSISALSVPQEMGAQSGQIQPVGWVENADGDTGEATVRIDNEGIHIFDGKIFLMDYAGNSVLSAAGFEGAWTDFLLNGLYNGGFRAGDVSSGLNSGNEINEGSTSADYLASLSGPIPFWVVNSIIQGGEYGIEEDATYGRSFKIAKADSSFQGVVSFYQDVPIGGNQLGYSVRLHMLLEPEESGQEVDVRVYYSERDSDHGIIGTETFSSEVTAVSTSLDYRPKPYIRNLVGNGVLDQSTRFLRVRIEADIGATSSTHLGSVRMFNIALAADLWDTQANWTLQNDTGASGILDSIQTRTTDFLINAGETAGGARLVIINGGGLVITPSSGNSSLGWSGTAGGSADIVLTRGAANRLDLASGDTLRLIGDTLQFGAADATLSRRTTGVLKLDTVLEQSGVISPTALSADVNNYAPTDGEKAFMWRLSSDATVRTITGIGVSAIQGSMHYLSNINTGTNIILAHQSGSSTSVLRFICPNGANLTLRPGGSVWIVYDGTTARWRVMGA